MNGFLTAATKSSEGNKEAVQFLASLDITSKYILSTRSQLRFSL